MNFGTGTLHTPPVVKNLLIINGLVFLAQTMLPGGTVGLITAKMALYFWDSPFFAPYQFVTHMFLHGSFSHLFFNMFALWMFGRTIEYDLGSKRFLTYYMATGIGAAILYSCVNWIQLRYMISAGAGEAAISQLINTPTIGASGAVYGVLLAFGMLHPNSIIMLLIPPIPMKAKYFVIIFMAIELVMGLTISDNVAHFAHLGGMLWGFLLLKYWKSKGLV